MLVRDDCKLVLVEHIRDVNSIPSEARVSRSKDRMVGFQSFTLHRQLFL